MNTRKTKAPTFGHGGPKFRGCRARARAENHETTSRRTRYPITPLEFMLQIVNDETESMALRAEMAKASAPYMHHKLTQLPIGGADRAAQHSLDVSKLDIEELVLLERLVAKSQIITPAKEFSVFETEE